MLVTQYSSWQHTEATSDSSWPVSRQGGERRCKVDQAMPDIKLLLLLYYVPDHCIASKFESLAKTFQWIQ
jgi:hypothetical protein